MTEDKWARVSGTRVFIPAADFQPQELENITTTRTSDYIEIKVGDLHTFSRKTRVEYQTYAVAVYDNGEYVDFCAFLSKGEARIPSGKYALTPTYTETGEIR